MKSTRNKYSTMVAVALLLSSLSGCAAVVVGGSIAGMLSATDRRTLGAQTEDKVIGLKAAALSGRFTMGSNINAVSFNRRLLLTGEASDESTRSKIEAEAKAIAGVERVHNEIEVVGVSSYTSRSNDALITAKVISSLVEAKTTQTNLIKVVTERGTVFLMGKVTTGEADAAVEIVRGVSGVLRVVKLFEYI